jgi:hypothetical protein
LLLKQTDTLPLHDVMPYYYMDEYIELLFKSKEDSDYKKVRKAAIFVCNDSFYTVANLVYGPKDVALAVILIGAKIMGVISPCGKYYDLEKLRQRALENKKTIPESSKYWYKILDPSINLKNVNEII